MENICDICGDPAEYFEPRFCYWSCWKHENVPPAYRYNYKRTFFNVTQQYSKEANIVVTPSK